MKSEFDFYLIYSIYDDNKFDSISIAFNVAIANKKNTKAIIVTNDSNVDNYESIEILAKHYRSNYIKMENDSIKIPELITKLSEFYKCMVDKCNIFNTVTFALWIIETCKFKIFIQKVSLNKLSQFEVAKDWNGLVDYIPSLRELLEVTQFNLEWILNRIKDNYRKFEEIKKFHDKNIRLASDPRFIVPNNSK